MSSAELLQAIRTLGLAEPQPGAFGAMDAEELRPMAGGFLVHLSLYAIGSVINGSFFVPVRVLNMDPILWGLGASFIATYVGCLVAGEPEERLVRKYFYAQ